MAADYSHQQECLNVIHAPGVNAGVVVLPTGAGKSRIEFDHARYVSENKDRHNIVIFIAPRIILCQQLIRDFAKQSAGVGMINKLGYFNQLLTFVSSGSVPKLKINNKNILQGNINTTKKAEIAKEIAFAENHNVDNYVFSTYASFWQCMEGVALAIKDNPAAYAIHLIADEAHYFARGNELKDGSERAFDALKKHLALFTTRFFFTATPKVKLDDVWGDSPGSSGLNNTIVYGPCSVFERKPMDLIPKNIITEPLLHRVRLPEGVNSENFDSYAGDFILKVFTEHERIVNQDCKDESAGHIGGKLMVAVGGSRQLAAIINSNLLVAARKAKINVAWTMSVDAVGTSIVSLNGDADGGIEDTEIGTVLDGVECKIDDFLQGIKDVCLTETIDTAGNTITKTNNSARLILLHYDRLTEGIDIPSMTGLLALRGMTKDKIIQNIGRVMRTHPDDKPKDYSDRNKTWIKPNCRIIVPEMGETDLLFSTIVEHLREQYDPNVQINSTNTAGGMGGDDDPEMLNELPVIPGAKTIHGDLIHEYEQYDEWEKNIIWQLENDNGVIPAIG
jgi:hypothetical protein